MRLRRCGLLLLLLVLVAGCGGGSADGPEARPPRADFGPAPMPPEGPLDDRLEADLDAVFSNLETIDRAVIRRIGAAGDARAAWLVSDLLRFVQDTAVTEDLVGAFERLSGTRLDASEREPGFAWNATTDRLIAWDLPAPPGYVDYKARLFTIVEPAWAPFFADRDADIDWRLVSWGGVLIDDRPLGDPKPCPEGCIPALDDPVVTDVAGGSWYPDDAIVFGVVVNGRARAYPKNIMEVHELVNDTLGGRRIGIPYCTLCASAQAYFTDTVRGRDLVLRTSGAARSLEQGHVRAEQQVGLRHLHRPSALRPASRSRRRPRADDRGEEYLGRLEGRAPRHVHRGPGRRHRSHVSRGSLGGRDDEGPIFPIGDVDPRLPVQEQVVGVIAPDGTPLVFPAAAARAALQAGGTVALAGIRLELDGDGLRAVRAGGGDAVSHQAFWFAWSQFHPSTVVWTPRLD